MRLAMIGMGWAGQHQAQALAELSGEMELACCVDDDPSHLVTVAAKLGVTETHADLADVL